MISEDNLDVFQEDLDLLFGTYRLSLYLKQQSVSIKRNREYRNKLVLRRRCSCNVLDQSE